MKAKVYVLCIALIALSISVSAQYYYKDIVKTQTLNSEFAILKNENLSTIALKSFEDDGTASEKFFCEKKIEKNYLRSEMISRSYITGQSLLTSFYNGKGLIIQTTDSTETAIGKTFYEYDDQKRLKVIRTITKANDEQQSITERHEYFYTDAGKPQKMLRSKNNTVVSTISFSLDDKMNVIDEEEIMKGIKGKKYFYYYDDKNHLTDVVHYNERAKRLLPDYMLEYNSQGQLRQMISVEEGASNYYTWKYAYNDLKLKETEKCYSKEKRVLGTIEYEYK
ncbi:MAG: hypothetical protein H0W12_07900 [Chitinophagaceae bacterium]|nr:hypothetical protein [Chitinophagaceae bacterium]